MRVIDSWTFDYRDNTERIEFARAAEIALEQGGKVQAENAGLVEGNPKR